MQLENYVELEQFTGYPLEVTADNVAVMLPILLVGPSAEAQPRPAAASSFSPFLLPPTEPYGTIKSNSQRQPQTN